MSKTKLIPRYIRCYDNGGATFDRYSVVFTKKRNAGQFMYLGMSSMPFDPQGFGQHGASDDRIDYPQYSHLGKPIKFVDLPEDCQSLVMSDYKVLWGDNQNVYRQS